MAAWLAVVVFFSLPRSKLVGYILPAAAPFALLAGEGFHAAWAAAPGRWVRLRPGLRSLAGFSALVCVCAVVVVAHVGSGAGRPAVTGESMAIWNVADNEAARAACRSQASAWTP